MHEQEIAEWVRQRYAAHPVEIGRSQHETPVRPEEIRKKSAGSFWGGLLWTVIPVGLLLLVVGLLAATMPSGEDGLGNAILGAFIYLVACAVSAVSLIVCIGFYLAKRLKTALGMSVGLSLVALALIGIFIAYANTGS